ncbi:MAG: hypothetical protein IJW86_09810 [Clostridia bacterium]|nr:hypothetical protein [Clostridia bacterium]
MDIKTNISTESISALKQYIASNELKTKRHRATILIHSNGKDYGPGFLVVNVTVNGDVGQIIIEDLHTIYGDCSNTFTTKDSSFSFVSNTLCIKINDSIFGKISINIT